MHSVLLHILKEKLNSTVVKWDPNSSRRKGMFKSPFLRPPTPILNTQTHLPTGAVSLGGGTKPCRITCRPAIKRTDMLLFYKLFCFRIKPRTAWLHTVFPFRGRGGGETHSENRSPNQNRHSTSYKNTRCLRCYCALCTGYQKHFGMDTTSVVIPGCWM